MKLVTYSYDAQKYIGVLIDNQVINVKKIYNHIKKQATDNTDDEVFSDMIKFLESGKDGMDIIKEIVQYTVKHQKVMKDLGYILKREDIRLESPIQQPRKIICVGHNYRDHILEMNREIPKVPVIFAKFNNTILGPEDPIPYPSITEKLDYEAEFSFVIGKRAKNISYDDALNYVAGYMIVNDISARDLQLRTVQWLQGKSLDGSAPMGPWLVTKDEINDPHNLNIKLYVNNEERQSSSTKNLVFNVPSLVEFLSEIMTLEPGDIICTGTPGGVGAANPSGFLHDGDIVKIEIDQIGVLENKVKKV